jgi:hypothetical protein
MTKDRGRRHFPQCVSEYHLSVQSCTLAGYRRKSRAGVLENHNELSLFALRYVRASEPTGPKNVNCSIYR